jgi:hypothetical protein
MFNNRRNPRITPIQPAMLGSAITPHILCTVIEFGTDMVTI